MGEKKVNSRKIFALILSVAMVFGSFTMSFAATDLESTSTNVTTFTDVTDHWGVNAINKWSGYGIINGFEGLFRPNDSITRGEMAVILDNIMDYQVTATNTFTDLKVGTFYTDAILKANAAGIIKGDGTVVRPTDKITREEVSVMFARAFALNESTSGTSTFDDSASIATWAKGYVKTMEAKVYVKGSNNNFLPKTKVTRAETVTIIDNIVKAYYAKAGTYTENVNGTVVIKVSDVILKGVNIAENLIIAEGVGQGDVILDSVIVKGNTAVRGGGENSVHIVGKSSITSIRIEKVEGKIRIVISDGNIVQETVVAKGEEIIITGTVGTLDLAASNATVYATAAEITGATITGSNSTIIVNSQSTIATVSISSTAANTNIQTETGAMVRTITADAKTTVSGQGTVTSVSLNAGADSSSITTPNTRTTVASGVTGATGGGGIAMPEGLTETNNSLGNNLVVTTSGASTGGGGSSSNSTARVSAITANLLPGVVTIGAQITLNTSTQDATIFYTLDGSIPTTASTKYTSPITIDSATTIKAIGTKSEMTDSSVATFSYTIAPEEMDPEEPSMTVSPTQVTANTNFNQTFLLSIQNDTVTTEAVITLGGAFNNLNLKDMNNTEKTVTVTVYGDLQNSGIGTISLAADVLEISNSPLAVNVEVLDSDIVEVSGISVITGTAKVGVELTAGTLTPAKATVSYQWEISSNGISYDNIAGATTNKYTPLAGDANKFIKVSATGTGSYTGTVTSTATTAIAVVNPVTPAAPSVTNDDTANTVTGMTTAMEYKLDTAGYTLYDATTFGLLDFSGVHTLIVRVAAEGINPASEEVILEFTTNLISESITSKAISNLTFSTIPASSAKIVSKIITFSDFRSPNNKKFTITDVNGDIITVDLWWNVAMNEYTPTFASAVGSAIESSIQDYVYAKYGANGLMTRTLYASYTGDTLYISTFTTGASAVIQLDGPDRTFFFDSQSAHGTDTNTTANRNFTVSDGIKTANITLASKFTSMASLVTNLNNKLKNAGVKAVIQKVDDNYFKIIGDPGVHLTVGGANYTEFFD